MVNQMSRPVAVLVVEAPHLRNPAASLKVVAQVVLGQEGCGRYLAEAHHFGRLSD